MLQYGEYFSIDNIPTKYLPTHVVQDHNNRKMHEIKCYGFPISQKNNLVCQYLDIKCSTDLSDAASF